MLEQKSALVVENCKIDSYSSIMLDDLNKQLSHYEGVYLVREEKSKKDGEKCALTMIVEFAISVGASVVSGALLELLKSVYAHHVHPKEYKWELLVTTKECLKIVVYKDKGVVLVDIQEASPETPTEV